MKRIQKQTWSLYFQDKNLIINQLSPAEVNRIIRVLGPKKLANSSYLDPKSGRWTQIDQTKVDQRPLDPVQWQAPPLYEQAKQKAAPAAQKPNPAQAKPAPATPLAKIQTEKKAIELSPGSEVLITIKTKAQFKIAKIDQNSFVTDPPFSTPQELSFEMNVGENKLKGKILASKGSKEPSVFQIQKVEKK